MAAYLRDMTETGPFFGRKALKECHLSPLALFLAISLYHAVNKHDHSFGFVRICFRTTVARWRWVANGRRQARWDRDRALTAVP